MCNYKKLFCSHYGMWIHLIFGSAVSTECKQTLKIVFENKEINGSELWATIGNKRGLQCFPEDGASLSNKIAIFYFTALKNMIYLFKRRNSGSYGTFICFFVCKAFCCTVDRTKVFAPLQHSVKPFTCVESAIQWTSLFSQRCRWWEERIAVSFCAWGLLVLHLCFGQSAFLPPTVLTGHVQDSRFYPVSTSEIRSTVRVCHCQPAIMHLSWWQSFVLCVQALWSIKTSKSELG